MATDVIVLFAHGARDPEWARPVEAVAKRLRDKFPDRLVEVAFLEFLQPTLPTLIENLMKEASGKQGSQIHILPFFIAQGGHLRKELPEMLAVLRTQYPGQVFNLLPPLGELPTVQDAMAEAIANLLP